jgi:ABC-type polysaccharide/polyol phosphate transport system ATPase subunit
MSNRPVVIDVENVTQRFRVIHERPDSLRELFARFFKQRMTYHDFEAVSDVSLKIRQGDMIGIVGRNGSGKSTLLKIISGVYRPTAGRLTVKGNIAPLIELGAGMHSDLTGRENILLNGLMMGYSKREMRQREESIIEFAEIGDFIDVPVKQYSSGMYMRLAFSVATEVDPDILVLDEILAVGDMQFQQKCFDRLRRFREAGKTILMVTHSMSPVEEYCNRAVLLNKGRIVLDSTPSEVVEQFTQIGGAREPVLVEAPSGHA